MKKFKPLIIVILFSISLLCHTQTTPFNRGVNLTGWFQVSSPRQIQFTKFTKQDFINIKSLGCDVIRLPINLHFMTDGTPDFTLDPLFLTFLDSVVAWAEELEIHLLLDNHTFDPAVSTSPDVGPVLIEVWSQMADHYKEQSDYIYYEIMNEPHGISDAQWGSIQGDVIEAIRKIDTKHTLIVGPAGWNSYHNLKNMPAYEDDNLIYTFHFYDPFLFTHQGASWTDVSMAPARDIPFPYDEARMPEVPSELIGTWVGNSYKDYPEKGTGEYIREMFDIAIDFRDTRNVPIYCGEFGVYNINSPHDDRVAWYDSVQNYLDENNIAWTIWDYTGGFGLFEAGGNDMFDHDLDTALVRAMDLNVPPQTEYEILPDTTGFLIFTDYIATQIIESSNAGEGTIDFYNTEHPNNDLYCIYWTGGGQYTNIGFDLKPNKDLQILVDSGYALDLMVRANVPGTGLDFRFLDTNTEDPEDHPWRVNHILDASVIAYDGVWHHIHIPLTKFSEGGAWEGDWYGPIGAYDWTAVDRFEIVAEHHPLDDDHFWFDNIMITKEDTAQVWDETVIPYVPVVPDQLADNVFSSGDIQVYPNPFSSEITIGYTLQQTSNVQLKIFDITGNLIVNLVDENQSTGRYLLEWNGKNNNGNTVKKGLYYCYFNTEDQHQVIKIVKM